MAKRMLLGAASITLAACAHLPPAQPPPQGAIATPVGGAPGYQHGHDSLLSEGEPVTQTVKQGVLAYIGSQATLTIDLRNGSTFGTPNAHATSLASRPLGDTPAAHDEFVKSYFQGHGLPANQILRVRTMTLLEAHGQSGARSKVSPAIMAYYSVLDRAVEGVPVPDSFAWARVNAERRVVAEGVYWPALSAEVVLGAKRLQQALTDPARQSALEAHIPADIVDRGVAIRHASAWVDGPFEAFASYDVAVLARATPNESQYERGRAPSSSPAGAIAILHFDQNGTERRLPQELRNISPERPASEQKSPR